MQPHHYNELDHWRNTSQRLQPSRSMNRSPVPSSSHYSSQSTSTSTENTSSPLDSNIKSTFIDRNSGWLESSPIQLSPSQSTTSYSAPIPKYNDNHNDSTKGEVLNAISHEDILKLTKLTKELPDVSRKHNLIQKEYRRQQPNLFAETDIRYTVDHPLESQSINSNDSRISDSGLTELLNQDFMKPTPSNTEYSGLTNTPSYNPSSISIETEDSQYSIQSNNNIEKILQKSNSKLDYPLSISTIPPAQNNQNNNNNGNEINNNNNNKNNNSNTTTSPPLTSTSDKRRSWYKSIMKRDKKKKSKSTVNVTALNNNIDFDEENDDDDNVRSASMDSYNRYNIGDPSHLPSDIQLTTSLSTPRKFLSNSMSIKKHLRLGSNYQRSTSILANYTSNNKAVDNKNNNKISTKQNSEKCEVNQTNNNKNNKTTKYDDENKRHLQHHGRRHSFDNFRDLNLQKDASTSTHPDTVHNNNNNNNNNNEENKLRSQSNIIPNSDNINNYMNSFIPSHNVSNNTISNINTHINIDSHSDINTKSIHGIATMISPSTTNLNNYTVSPNIITSPNTFHITSPDTNTATIAKLDLDKTNSSNIHNPYHNILDKVQQDVLINNQNQNLSSSQQQQQQQQLQNNFDDNDDNDDDNSDNSDDGGDNNDDDYQIFSETKQNQLNVFIEQQQQQQQQQQSQSQPQKELTKVLYFDYQSLPRDDKNGRPTNLKGLIKSLVDHNYGTITERRIKYNWNIDKIDNIFDGDDDDDDVENIDDDKKDKEKNENDDDSINDKNDQGENDHDINDDNNDDEATSSDDTTSLDASKVIIGDICTVLSKGFQNIKSRKREIAEIHLSQEDDVGFTKLIQIPDEAYHEKGRLLNLYVSFFGPNNGDDDISIQNDAAKNLCKTVNDRLESLDPFIDEAKAFLADRAQQYHTFVPVDDHNNEFVHRRGSLKNSDHEHLTIIDGQTIAARKNSLNTNNNNGSNSIPTSDGIVNNNKKVTISIPEVMTAPLPTSSSTSLLLQNSTKPQQNNPPPLLHSSSSSLWSNFPYKEYNAYEYRQEQLNDAVLDLQRGIDEFKRSLQDTERMVRAVQIDMNDTKVKMDTYLKDVPETHYSELKRLEVSIESILANRAKSRSMELFYLLLTFLLTCFAFLLWAVICVFKIGQTAISFPKKMIISFNEYMEERNKIVKQAGMRSVARGVDRPRSYSSDSLNSFKLSPNEILRPSHSSSTANYSRRPSRVSS